MSVTSDDLARWAHEQQERAIHKADLPSVHLWWIVDGAVTASYCGIPATLGEEWGWGHPECGPQWPMAVDGRCPSCHRPICPTCAKVAQAASAT